MNTPLMNVLNLIFESQQKYVAAVGVVQCRDRWLLGLSTANDDRKNKWVFPGGGIKSTETPEQAAVREVREETGVTCRAFGKAFSYGCKKNVAFVHCKASSIKSLDNNSEFSALGWFKVSEMKGLILYYNVRTLINMVTK